jgi:hypothetical protein
MTSAEKAGGAKILKKNTFIHFNENEQTHT